MPERMSGRENSRSSPLRKSSSHSPVRSSERKRRERSITPRSVRKYKKRPTLSRSRSTSPRRRNSYSRSPYNSRRRNDQRPHPCRCIGIFGLNINTDEAKIRDIFEKFGPIERVQMVIDAQTGRSRGFCFVYYDDVADARVAKDKCSGIELDGRHIRVDYSITQRPHTPTPGRYMGKVTRNYNRDYGNKRRVVYDNNGRSPSPYYRDSRKRRFEKSRSRSYYERSRSRSYSPREKRSDRRYR